MFAKCAIFLLATLVCVSSAEEDAVDMKNVVELGPNNSAMIWEGKWLVSYYAPWCGQCKHFKPVFADLSVTTEGGDMKMAQVDCTVHSSICSQAGVDSYPTIRYYISGKETDYNGWRSLEELEKFVAKMNNPTPEAVSAEEIPSWLEEGKKVSMVTFIYHHNEGDAQAFETFTQAYLALADVAFLRLKYTPTTEASRLECHNDAGVLKYEGPLETEGMVQFVKQNRFLVVEELGPNNYYEMTNLRKNIAMYLYNPDVGSEEGTRQMLEVGEDLALKETFLFATMSGGNKGWLVKLDIAPEELPVLVVYDHIIDSMYLNKGIIGKYHAPSVATAAMKGFLQNVKAGNVKEVALAYKSYFKMILRFIYAPSLEWPEPKQIIAASAVAIAGSTICMIITVFFYLRSDKGAEAEEEDKPTSKKSKKESKKQK